MELVAYYKYLSDLELIDSAELMHTSLSNNASFLEQYPFMVAKLALLKEAKETFRVAYHEALTRDVVKVERRKVKRVDLHKVMGNVGQFAVAVADDDTSVLIGTGIEVKRKRNASSHAPPQAPPNFTVKHGSTRGTMVGRISKFAGAGGFEVYVTEGDPTLEEGWSFWASFVGGSRMEMSGFQPGKQYSLRTRAINGSGAGPWSPVVSLISI